MSRRRNLFLLWSVLCALSVPVFAANRPAGVVAALQSPAWLERARHRTPLAPGVALQAGDIVETGAGARVEIQMADDSTVKLGERARFVLAQWSAPAHEGVVHGVLRVLRGAFRYTAHVLAQAKQRRESRWTWRA